MKESIRIRFCIAIGILFLTVIWTNEIQAQVKVGGFPDPQLSQKDNDHLDRQAKVFLDTVQSILSEFPPLINEGWERGFAKLLLDAVHHEQYAAFRKPVQQFFHSQIEKSITELENTEVDEGGIILKSDKEYN